MTSMITATVKRKSKPVIQYFITRPQITQFYCDLRDGKYKGRKKQREAIERMLFEAAKAGVIGP